MTNRDRVIELMRTSQTRLCQAFETMDSAALFTTKTWERPSSSDSTAGGGGTARVLSEGAVFEKAGINTSAVFGEQTPPTLWQAHPNTKGQPYFATGLSMVFHPRNPFVPAFHANFRYFESGDGDTSEGWFGGGMDLTPSYGCVEDAQHFHRTLQAYCARHGADYAALKKTCDDYFYLKHRKEMRGVGGIFFDEIGLGSFERTFEFVRDGVETILQAYEPIVRRRKDMPFGERERQWQLYRRGRYVEFNLVYDRGTLFGLQTEGNIEAILMSLPPLARWAFDLTPQPGSPEADTLTYLQPRSWL
jgi:coproporphyrinogen III oxidase